MDKINDLLIRRSEYKEEIEEKKREIRKYEREYESLRQFDGDVNAAYGNFQSVNTVKLNCISELSGITERSRTARLYLEGSQRTMNGIGAKIVGAAFVGLGVMIRFKIEEYRMKIRNCENRIASLERRIESVDSMIAAERAAQARAEEMEG